MLMEKVEDYFRQAGCDINRVEVFVPNEDAHSFYKELNYHDRDIDMFKLLVMDGKKICTKKWN